MHHWLINDPDSPIDPADFKSREKKEAMFTEWMDKTLSTRRAKINRLKKLKDFVVDDDDVDYEDEGENSSDELDDLD